MTAKDVLLKQLTDAQLVFENFTKDFSEEDARFQPAAGGNHLNWILMHLAVSADGILNAVTGEPKQLSEEVHKKYQGGSTCEPDDGMTRADAWKTFTDQHARTIASVKTLDESRYAEPNPTGSEMFPTIGALVGLLAVHPFWHFGQLTVNRRMLGKPQVF